MQRLLFQCLLVVLSVSTVAIFFSPEENLVKLPKERRVEEMAKQEFEMTKDLATNTLSRKEIYKISKQIENNTIRSGNTLFWEERGPDNFGGRTRTMAFDPSDPSGNTIWTGGVAGGLWKLTDAFSNNYTWERISSYTGNSAISSIVIDPSNHDVIYVSTGEGWFNADAYQGDGIYRSLDGGRTWNRLESTANTTFRYVQKLLIAGDRLFACTRAGGIQMSLDRGETWVKSLGNGQFGFSERAGDIDLATDGALYAGMGFNGSNDGVYKSTDNGDSWEFLDIPGYLPRRVELAVSPSNPDVIYVLKEAPSSRSVEEIVKSKNGGLNWEILEAPPAFGMDFFTRNQAWYDLSITIDPNDEDRIFIGGVDLLLSEDGGENWRQISQWFGGFGLQEVHADQHFAGYLPGDGNKAVFTNDGGLFLTENATAPVPIVEWKNQGYNTIQFYACAIHPTIENYFLGGTQDNGTHLFEDPGINSTFEVTGGDGAYCHIDRDNPNIQISSFVFNSYWVTTNAWNSDQRYSLSGSRGSFINPTDYDDDNDMLICSGNTGEIITLDVHTGVFDSLEISQMIGQRASAIKVHPTDNTIIYVGTNGGNIFQVNNLIQGSPTVSRIYAGSGNIRSIDLDLNNTDRIVFCISNVNALSVFVSEDAGESWTNQEGDLPNMPIRWAVWNPANPNGVILGTELGVWTTDAIQGEDDTEWVYNNFGSAPTRIDMLDVRHSDFTVLAASHGRGMFTANVCSGAIDNDGDGFSCDEDCNDFNSAMNADADEIPYNGLDDDCNEATLDDDLDMDGYGIADDCDDQDPAINPDAVEIEGNGVDENCDGLDEEPPCGDFATGPWDIFANAGNCIDGPANSTWQIWSNESYVVNELRDGVSYFIDFCDGYSTDVFEANVLVYSYNIATAERGDLLSSLGDCRVEFDYTDNADFPNVLIILQDVNDCNADSDMTGNGLISFGCISSGIDMDGDGFTDEIDCDDTNADINPGVMETYYNGLDDDCDEETIDNDQDGDGFSIDEDCDDENAEINPSATEVLFNGIDDDCDASTLDNDLDGDGFGLDEDCDESNPDVNPGATEIPGNGIDDDCDPTTLDNDFDGDGFGLDEDCDDTNPDVNPNAEEIPGNGIDEDCDGLDGPSAVHDLSGTKINVYPNPSRGMLFIDSEGLRLNVKVFSEIGNLVRESNEQSQLDLSDVEDGMYMVVITDVNTNKSVVEKLILVK